MISIILSIVFLGLSLLDVILTNKVISNGGTELNPIMKWFMNRFGKYWWIPKMTISCFLVLGLLVYNKLIIFIVLVILQLLIDLWNIKELKK